MASLFDFLEGRSQAPSGTTPSDVNSEKTSNPPTLTLTKKEKAAKLALIARIRLRKNLKSNFPEFMRHFWRVVEPDTPLVWNWHLDVLADELVTAPPSAKVVFNVPPGTGKSLTFVLFRAWLWANNAQLRFFNASYGAHLSVRDNVKLRNLIQSREYQLLFPNVQLRGDQNAKERFETTEGGWSVATSVGGAGTGEHPDYKFIDDPLSEQQSRSPVERLEANLWIDRTLTMRGLTRNVRSFLIMQRLHEDDPTGHVMKQGGWKLVRFPMRFEKCTCPKPYYCEGCGAEFDTNKSIWDNGVTWAHDNPLLLPCGPVFSRPDQELIRCPLHKADPNWQPDPRDLRTIPGELLMPTLFTEAKVRGVELALGPYGTAGQLQQRPSPEGGGLFKREWFSIVDALPSAPRSKVREARGWDTAGTEGDGDWTVGVRIYQVEIQPETRLKRLGHPDDITPAQYHYYITSVVRAQTANVDKLIRATAEADGRNVDQREEKEGGSAGVAVIRARANALRGYPYSGVQISGDKVTRAKPFRTQCEAGNVFLLRGEWNTVYLDELTHFPTGDHDDQVDGSSCAFNALLMDKPKQTKATWGRG
jgi:predicted phage terminase large subunit-like protein